MDMSHLYAPHDGFNTWLGAFLAHFFAPAIVNNAINGKWLISAAYVLVVAVPYLWKRLGFCPWRWTPPAPFSLDLDADLPSLLAYRELGEVGSGKQSLICSKCLQTVAPTSSTSQM